MTGARRILDNAAYKAGWYFIAVVGDYTTAGVGHRPLTQQPKEPT